MNIDARGDDILAQATRLLRQHTDAGWTAMSATVLDRALAAFRPSEPVRGRHRAGDFFVAGTVITAELRRVVDAVPNAAATRISCATDDRQHLTGVTIEIIAAYGSHLVTLADHIHATAINTLADILGDLAPPAGAVHTHVHIGDVTNDPHEVL